MDITIKASDGKLFCGTNYLALVAEVNAHESDLKLKKEKEDAEKKARGEAKEYRYNQVLDKIDSLNKVIESYEKETGEKLVFGFVNGKLKTGQVGHTGKYTGIPTVSLITHDDWLNQLRKSLRAQ